MASKDESVTNALDSTGRIMSMLVQSAASDADFIQPMSGAVFLGSQYADPLFRGGAWKKSVDIPVSSWGLPPYDLGRTNYSNGLISEGKLYTWGWTGLVGGRTGSDIPLGQVGSDTTWTMIAAAKSACAAIKADGSLWSWGANALGVTGLNTTSGTTTTPTRVGSDNDWSTIWSCGNSSGTVSTFFALKTNGLVYSWGSNTNGGQPSATGSTNVPTLCAAAPTGIASIVTSERGCFAITTTGELWACGVDTYGQMGRAPSASGTTYNWGQIGTDTDWQKVWTGRGLSVFRKTNGAYYFLGQTSAGGAANAARVPGSPVGSTGYSLYTTPQALPSSTLALPEGRTVSDMGIDINNTYVIYDDGMVKSWGSSGSGVFAGFVPPHAKILSMGGNACSVIFWT